MSEYLDCRRMRLGKDLEEATKVLERMALNRNGRKGLPWDGTIYCEAKPVRVVDEEGMTWDLEPSAYAYNDNMPAGIRLTCKIIDNEVYELKKADRGLKSPKQEFDPFEL